MTAETKPRFFAGNWKNKIEEVQTLLDWTAQFSKLLTTNLATREKLNRAQIIVCVPFALLSLMRGRTSELSLPISVGAQDVSQFKGEDKPVTGEVTAKMLKSLGVEWVIVGHSERRSKLKEVDEILAEKVNCAHGQGLKVIYCVPDAQTVVPTGVAVVAYEPVWSIGTGQAEEPAMANQVIAQIKAQTHTAVAIYGGSVIPDNVAGYLAQPSIDGVLPGGASLKAETFLTLITNGISS